MAITEDHLEQLALTWFQDTGWEYRRGPNITPAGEREEVLVGLLDAMKCQGE